MIPRPWAADDAPAVAVLLSAIWGHDPTAHAVFSVHGAARDESGLFGRTLVAEIGGDVAGVGTVRESRLHPARWRVVLHVHPAHRRRGVGAALFEGLIRELADREPRPLQAATRADDGAGRWFLDRRGFRLLMRTRRGTLNPRAIHRAQRRAFAAATARVTAAGYRLVAGSDLRLAADPTRALAALHAEVYRLAHAWNPVAPLSKTEAVALFLDPDDLIPAALFVAVTGDAPVAVASLRRGRSPGGVDLGWVGAVGAHRGWGADLAAALVGRCLGYAADEGWAVRVEVDEADAHLWRLVGALPVVWEPDWLTFATPGPRTAGNP